MKLKQKTVRIQRPRTGSKYAYIGKTKVTGLNPTQMAKLTRTVSRKVSNKMSKPTERQLEALKQYRRITSSVRRLEKAGYTFNEQELQSYIAAITKTTGSGRDIKQAHIITSKAIEKMQSIKGKDLKVLALNYEEKQQELSEKRREAQRRAAHARRLNRITREAQATQTMLDDKIRTLNDYFELSADEGLPSLTPRITPPVILPQEMIDTLPTESEIYLENFEKIYTKYAERNLQEEEFDALRLLIDDCFHAQSINEHNMRMAGQGKKRKDGRPPNTSAFSYYKLVLKWISEMTAKYGMPVVMAAVAEAYKNGAWQDVHNFYSYETASDLINGLNRGLTAISEKFSLENMSKDLPWLLENIAPNVSFDTMFVQPEILPK